MEAHPIPKSLRLFFLSCIALGISLAVLLGSFNVFDGFPGWIVASTGLIFLFLGISFAFINGRGWLRAAYPAQKMKTHAEELQESLKEISDYKYALDESCIVAITDQKGVIRYVNDNFCRISKYTREELIGQDHRIINSGFHSKEFIRDIWVTIANGKVWKGEVRNKAKDGSYYWVDTTIVPFLDSNKKPFQYVAIRADITERKEAEERQARSYKEIQDYKDALDESSIVAITDQRGIIKYVNNNFCKISKYSKQELLGQDHRIINSGYHSKEFIRDIWVTIANGKVWKGEIKNKAKDGTYYWVDTTIVPFLDKNNKPFQYLAIRSDITGKKNTEEANHELKKNVSAKTEELSGIFERITDGFIVLDKEFRYTYANSRIGEITGHAPATLIGKNVWNAFPDAVNSDTYKAFCRAIEEQRYICNIDYYAPLDLWQENHIYPTRDGLSIFIRDITEQKRAERSVKELNVNLEHKVAERTSQLEFANKEMESFSYSVAHDLRSPVRAMHGYATMLKEDHSASLDDEGKRLISEIEYNSKTMGTLIDDLLTFSRLGRKEISKTQVNMNRMVEEVSAELHLANPCSAQINIGNLHPVLADSALIKHVITNLLSNAIKYSSKREAPVVEISSVLEGGYITFSVKDNGVGFDMEFADKLFGVFQRLHSEEEFEGTGVGLAIVQRIVLRHGGRVWAYAKENEGATFYFNLPVHNN